MGATQACPTLVVFRHCRNWHQCRVILQMTLSREVVKHCPGLDTVPRISVGRNGVWPDPDEFREMVRRHGPPAPRVNLHSKVTLFFLRYNDPPPCGTEGQLERSRSRTSPQDEPSQSFLCRSSLVAFPSLPDEKEFLQPEGGANLDEISHLRGSLLYDIPQIMFLGHSRSTAPRDVPLRNVSAASVQDCSDQVGCSALVSEIGFFLVRSGQVRQKISIRRSLTRMFFRLSQA